MSTLALWLLNVLSIAILLAFVRLILGPNIPDRLVALDLLAIMGVGMAALYAVAFDQPVYLDVAIVLALVAFLGTVTFARYVEKWAHHGD